MKIMREIAPLRHALERWSKTHADAGERTTKPVIGLVPTMGYLHAGHMRLVQEARQTCDLVVLSIFVNPLQFGPNEDYNRYPRDEERDLAIARKNGVDVVFIPDVEEMYPDRIRTTVTVSGPLTDQLCGATRPGHFDGVATVVMKLFQIVQPHKAFFGMKDVQQVAVVQRMCKDLNVPVEIVATPTVRESDGLAKSSRNVYLSVEERRQATVLHQALLQAQTLAQTEKGIRAEEIRRQLRATIASAPLAELEYAEVLSYPDLVRLDPEQPLSTIGTTPILVAVAVRFGPTRLIDNIVFSLASDDTNESFTGGESLCTEH